MARKLLEHTEQRFRLNYIVGNRMNEDNAPEQEEFDDPVTDPETTAPSTTKCVGDGICNSRRT